MNVNGIIGYNKQGSSLNRLLAAYGNDVVNVSTGLGYSLNLTSTLAVDFKVFLDRVFFQNYSELPKTFNGTAWTTKHVGRTMLAKYQRPYKNRMFLANCKFPGPQAPLDIDGNAITFPSYMFHSDPYSGGELTWGIEWGQNGVTTVGSNLFQLSGFPVQDFVAHNIKVGDPLFITNGNTLLAQQPYTVAAITPYTLTINETFPVSASNLHYWVGRNWIPVADGDNDQIMGLEENKAVDRLLPFKLFSLWYYTGSALRSASDRFGTPSSRSILTYAGYTYYFHGSNSKVTGIYRSDSVSTKKISRGLDPYFAGMSDGNFPFVVGWVEGEELRWFIGDISNPNYDISITKAVVTYNTTTGSWDVSPIADNITCSTEFKQGSALSSFVGTDAGRVLNMGNGYSFNGSPINMSCDTKVYYPSGSDTINQYQKVQVIGRNCRGIKLYYKLWDDRNGNVDDNWNFLGEVQADKSEFTFPAVHQNAAGLQYRYMEEGILENDFLIEKTETFFRPITKRLN